MTNFAKTVSPQIAQNVMSVCGGVWSFGADTKDKNRYTVSVTPEDKTRLGAQNRLLYHWHREVLAQKPAFKSVKTIHAKMKLWELLLLYRSWGGSYAFQAEICNNAVNSCRNTRTHDLEDIQAFVADRMLRTSTLGVKKFCEYLNAYEAYWTLKGVRLTTSEDIYFEAMGLKK